jgi:hypothetical protein
VPKLYVANVTSQVWEFAYWLPEAPRHYTQTIQIGSQTQVPGPGRDLQQPALDSILAQHQPYGLVGADEALRGSHFYGLAYSIDKPVPFEKMQRLVAKYRGVLNDRGIEARRNAAIATNEYIERNLFENQMPDQLKQLDVSVEEMSRPEQFEGPETSQGFTVVRSEEDRPRPTRNVRSSRRRVAA